MDIDHESIKIIKSKYWKNGWLDRNDQKLNESDAKYLSEQGWDLGDISMSHDDLVGEIITMSQNQHLKDCVSMLSQSLSSRRLYDRSFLSSVTQASMIPKHTHSSDDACPVCGLYQTENVDQDVMLFEKVMWGGVRLTSLKYIWLDLKLLKESCKPEFNSEALFELVESINARTGELSASKFATSLKEVKGNKAEREVLCGILGICDILQHPEYPGFLQSYKNASEREMPDQHFMDLEWPYCWYNSKFGVNMSAFEDFTQ